MKRPRRNRPAPAPSTPAVAPPAPRRPWWPHAVALAVVLAVNLLLYARTLHLGFFSLDDPYYVVNNDGITPLNLANLKLMWSTPYFANYSPMHLLSYAVDVALAGGKSAFALHLSNVIWSVAVAGLVYLLAYTVRAELVTAALAALLFVVHPAHVEVVAWISSRKDLVATAFATLAMTCYLLYRRRASPTWYLACVSAFLLASAGKQSVVLLPAVLWLWDFLVEKRRSWTMFADKLPFGLVALFFAWRTAGSQPDTLMPHSLFRLSGILLHDLWLLTGLGDYVLYRRGFETGPAVGLLALAVPALAVLVVALPWLLRRWLHPVLPALAYGVLIHLVPPMVLSFFTPVADRYLFLASVPLCILLACGVGDLPWPRWRRSIGLVLGGAVCLLWAGKTWSYVSEWRDPRSVWFAAAAKSDVPEVCEYLGAVYQDAGDRVDVFVQTGQGLAVNDELPLARALLGDTSALQGLTREWQDPPAVRPATAAYRDRLWTLAWSAFEDAVARLGTLNTPKLFLRRGKLLVGRGQAAEAIPELQRGLQLARTHTYERLRQEDGTVIARALGIAYWSLGRYRDALPYFEEALRVQRASGQVWSPALESELAKLRGLAQASP
jgi:hypothetical protein